MRQFTVTLMVVFVSLVGCGDDGGTTTGGDDGQVADATNDDTTGDPSTDDATDDAGPAVCEHPCLNEFDQSDKKLCPDPKSDWTCEAGCCEPVFRCTSDDDCAAQGFEEGQCTDESALCLCDVDSGACSSQPCEVNAQCGDGMSCAGGTCLALPGDSSHALRIVTRATVLTSGASTTVGVEAYWPAIPDLISAATGVSWASDNPAAVSVDEAGVATGGEDAGEATLTATDDAGQAASVTLRNVAPAADATLTVVAVSEGTATALTGHYAVVDASSGDTVDAGAIPDTGVVSVTATDADSFDVHVFADDHDWVSHLGVTSATLMAPAARTMWGRIEMTDDGDLLESTELVGATVVEGTVDMGDYSKEGEVELTLTALPFSAGLFDFNLESILGASVLRYFHPDTAIPGVDTTETLDMPGGLTFSFAGPAIPTYILNVPPGESTIWTLGGRIGLDEVFAFSDDIFEAFGGGAINFGELASYLMPFFTDFWSGTAHGTNLTAEEGIIHPLNTTLRIPLAVETTVLVPPLPAVGDLGWADTVFAIGGALTADELFYPLGLAAAGDTSDETKWPADGMVDGIEETPEPDPLRLNLAPLHTALGGPHTHCATTVVALSIREDGDDPRPEGGSAIMLRQPLGTGHLKTIPEVSFLGFTMASTWDEATRAASLETVDGADTTRLLFKGKKGDNWAIWMNGRAAYTVPTPSELVTEMTTDRAVDTYSTLVSNFDLAADVSLDQLRQTGAPTLEALLHTVDRTSFVGLETLGN